MKKITSLLVVFAMIVTMFTFPVNVSAQQDDGWTVLVDDDYNYSATTVIGTSYASTLPYKKVSSETVFTPSFEKLNGVNILKMEYSGTTAVNAHKEVRHKFSDTAVSEGLIEHKFSVYFPSNVSNGSGGTYNSNGATIWEGVSNGSTDLVALQFSLNSAGYANLSYYGSSYGVSGSVVKNIPFDKWISVTTYANINSKTYSTTVGWDGAVKGSCEDIPWNSSAYNPTKLRHYIQKNSVNALYYISDESVRHISTQGMAQADLNSLSVPANPETDFTVATKGSVYGSAVTWSTSSPALTVDGGNISLNNQQTETTATLTASVTLGGNTYTKDFLVTVPAVVDSNITTIATEPFNYAENTAITSKTATNNMPWYIQASDTNNFTASIVKDGSDNCLKMEVPSAITDTSNHKSIQRELLTQAPDGIVNYSFKVKAPYDAQNSTVNSSANLWVAVTDTGKCEMATITHQIRGTKLYNQHVPCTTETPGGTYKEAGVSTGLTFAGGAEITYNISIDTNNHTYVLNVTDGVQSHTSDTYTIRNYGRGLHGYTGIPSGIKVYFERSNKSAVGYVDDIVVTNISNQKIAEADLESLNIPSNPTEDFQVPSVGSEYKNAVTWSTGSVALIVDGTNVTLNPQGTAVDAVLTATVTLGGVAYTKDFTVTVPKNNDITGLLNEEFDYPANTVIGTATTDTMPWKIASSDATNFGAVIAQDAGNKYLKFNTMPTLNETSAHKTIIRQFSTDGANNIVNYSVSVYAPSGVSNGAGGTYNTGTHNLWISLTDTKNCEMLSVTATIKGGNVAVQHVPRTTALSESYKEAAVVSPVKFDMNKWITFSAVVDLQANTYVLSVTDGVKTHTFDKAIIRNIGRGMAGYTGKPAHVRIFGERGHANTLCYVDNIIVDELSYKYTVKCDAEKIEVPAQPVVDFKLPVAGELYESNITWSSNSDAITVDASGNATINPKQTDTAVTLTASVTRGTYTETKIFNVVVKSEEYVAKEALKHIINSLTFKDISGVKEYYVTGDFTPVVNNLPAGVTATFTTDNAAITMNNGVAKVTKGKNDTNVNFTVTLKDVNNYTVSKTFKVLVHGNGTTVYYQDFDDITLKDKSVSNMSGWSVDNESVDVATTGSTSIIKNDNGDGYLDTQRFRSNSVNQYAGTNLNSSVLGDAVVQFRAKFTGDENFWWIFYMKGDYVKGDGTKETNQVLSQLSFDTLHAVDNKNYKSGINGPVPDNTFSSIYEGEIPFDKWFDFRIIFHTQDSTYDLYIDDVKVTNEPIKTYTWAEGKKISKISNINVGVARNYEWKGNFYFDDLTVRYLADDETLLENAASNLAIGGKNIMFDMTLPNTAGFETSVTWSSKNGFVDSNGKVTRAYGLGSDKDTLTATVTRNSTSITKDFDINVIRQPYYEVEQVVFDDKDGNQTLMPVAGGKIKSISVLENQAVSGARIYVAVYDIDSLVSVDVYDATSGDIAVNRTLPNDRDITVKALVWNEEIPVAYEYMASTKPQDDFTIYVAGDSICATTNKAANHDPATTQYGWGEVINLMFDEDYVSVDNYAAGGRSSRSFIDEGKLQSIIEKIEPGDYLFVKFGHNDQKPEEPEKYTTLGEDGTYRKYLQMYIDAARDKGATPVLVTSIYRRRFENGVSVDTQCGYPEEMKAYAQTVNVPVIDLHQKTGTWLTQIGDEASKAYFMTHAGDNTHLSYNGAVELNRMAKEEMERLGLPLNVYFK